jgi:protein-tyrosine phosphatase
MINEPPWTTAFAFAPYQAMKKSVLNVAVHPLEGRERVTRKFRAPRDAPGAPPRRVPVALRWCLPIGVVTFAALFTGVATGCSGRTFSELSDGSFGRDVEQGPNLGRDAERDAEHVSDPDAAAEDEGAGAVTCSPSRTVLVGDVLNARDLGGIALNETSTISCGGLYRGAPLSLTSEGCAHFSQLGIRTVIDLRIPSERTSSPNAACTEATSTAVLAPLPVPYNVSPADYIADLDTSDSIATIFGSVLSHPEAYPVYFHCTWGRDRTGVVAAIILLVLGASRDAIMQEYLLSQASVGAYPVSLTAVLDEIERRGGVVAYLLASGVSAEAVAQLRAQMTAL